MKLKISFIFVLTLAGAVSAQTPTPKVANLPEPRAYVYRETGGQKLQAFVFAPQGAVPGKPTAAVLLFHGGGWIAGSADWTFEAARRFAAHGLLAASIDYRLVNETITPIEALDDTRAAFRWIRSKAVEFGIDPKRVAGYGVSAGGHLVAAAGTIDFPGEKIDGTNSKPDLLLLWSPALGVEADGWFIKILRNRGKASDHSPLEHAGASAPPACIVNGDKDTLTPLPRAEQFRDRIIRAGGVCELHVYPNVGHLLTRNLADQEDNYDPDPQFRAEGNQRLIDFLRKHGFILDK
ncbi:MAG: alpha/beta hydrolase [Candidatus Aminicenantes bacterium]|nr:alpha/beta hydrolase [Candidatus Aminicenantes bacterium]